MPKRHRQPEPINILHAGATATATPLAASSPSQQSGGPSKAPSSGSPQPSSLNFPATPDELSRQRRRDEALAQRRRLLYDKDGQVVSPPDRHGEGEAEALVEEVASLASGDEAYSSTDYFGDDGNQLEGDGGLRSDESDDDLSQLRNAVRAADHHRRRQLSKGALNSRAAESATDSAMSDDLDKGSSEEDDGDDESDSSFFMDGEDEEGAEQRLDGHVSSSSEDDGGDLVTVDFGVYDMEADNVDGILHLMDQLCPDKMNEIDRDELGKALYESPYTCIVRLQNNGDDATGEEAQEFYGVASVLDVAHGRQLYPKALQSLQNLLQTQVWRQAAPGIPPMDIITSVDGAGGRAKCLLLISEFIRNIPLELTVQILEDILHRIEAAADGGTDKAARQRQPPSGATHGSPIFVTHPPMIAVLAKVQRTTDIPVTLLKKDGSAVDAPVQQRSGDARSRKDTGKKHRTAEAGSGRAATTTSSGAGALPNLDLSNYIFWREEDSILYSFRDQRVATLVYRCRPQYDGQPEHEIPLSIFFLLQWGAMMQAVGEMKRRQTAAADVERY